MLLFFTFKYLFLLNKSLTQLFRLISTRQSNINTISKNMVNKIYPDVSRFNKITDLVLLHLYVGKITVKVKKYIIYIFIAIIIIIIIV